MITFIEYLLGSTVMQELSAGTNGWLYELLKYKLSNWKLRYYDLNVLDSISLGILGQYSFEIAKISTLLSNPQIIEDTKNWADDAITTGESTAEQTANNDLNYAGFNVSGKFEETKATNTATNTTTAKTNNVNLLNQFLRLSDSNIKALGNEILNNFADLCILWYN